MTRQESASVAERNVALCVSISGWCQPTVGCMPPERRSARSSNPSGPIGGGARPDEGARGARGLALDCPRLSLVHEKDCEVAGGRHGLQLRIGSRPLKPAFSNNYHKESRNKGCSS